MSDVRTALKAYGADVRSAPQMSRSETREWATALVRARQECWCAILSYPPFVDPILDKIESERTKRKSKRLDRARLTALRLASRTLRDRNTTANKTAFDEALRFSSKVLGVERPRCAVRHIVQELERLASGEPPCLFLRRPPRGSHVFGEYVTRTTEAFRDLRALINIGVESNLRLVLRFAHRMTHVPLPVEARVQAGNEGLMRALEDYDPERGAVSTHSSWWIKSIIRREGQRHGRTIRLPVWAIEAGDRIVRHGKDDATPQQIAAEFNLTESAAATVLETLRIRTMSLDTHPIGHDGLLLEDRIAAEQPDEEDCMARDEDRRTIRALLWELPVRHRQILEQRFGFHGDPKSLREIGSEFGVSRERIRQLQVEALACLRSILKDERRTRLLVDGYELLERLASAP